MVAARGCFGERQAVVEAFSRTYAPAYCVGLLLLADAEAVVHDDVIYDDATLVRMLGEHLRMP